jgi:hypothetical protein
MIIHHDDLYFDRIAVPNMLSMDKDMCQSGPEYAKSGHGYANFSPLKYAKTRTNLCGSFPGPNASLTERITVGASG